MTIEKDAFNLFKSQYLNFVEQNQDKQTITRYLTEMNFLKKLEEQAISNHFVEELDELMDRKNIVLKELEKYGVRPKY